MTLVSRVNEALENSHILSRKAFSTACKEDPCVVEVVALQRSKMLSQAYSSALLIRQP